MNNLPVGIVAELNGKFGLIDIQNQNLTAFIYDDMFVSEDKIYASKNKKWGRIDKKGNIIVDFKYYDPMEI